MIKRGVGNTDIAILSEMSKVNVLHQNLSEMVWTRTMKMIIYYELIVLHCSVAEITAQPSLFIRMKGANV